MTEKFDDLGYPAGTVAIATVKGVDNVLVFRRLTTAGYDWAFNPVPELGLEYSCSHDSEGLVSNIVVDNSVKAPVPVRAPYDITTITARKLEDALTEILGEGEESGHDYYDESTGINAFYHTLAQTGGYGYGDVSLPESAVVGKSGDKTTIDVPGLGLFTAVDHKTEFMAESGDADSTVVFEFNGRHFRKQGYLDSYEGGVWDGRIEEVKPVERKVTFWEAI